MRLVKKIKNLTEAIDEWFISYRDTSIRMYAEEIEADPIETMDFIQTIKSFKKFSFMRGIVEPGYLIRYYLSKEQTTQLRKLEWYKQARFYTEVGALELIKFSIYTIPVYMILKK